MIVCLCEGVTSQQIDAALRDGAPPVRAIGRATGAGTSCGSCACDLRATLRARREGAEVACARQAPPTADRGVAARQAR